MKFTLEQHLRIALTLFVLALACVAGASVAYLRGLDATSAIEGKMDESERYMYELAVQTDGNGADSAISAIIPECDRRAEYESLLVKLGDLPKRDLLLLQNLFEACGAFDAQRKALMVAKLEREFESYVTYQTLLTELGGEGRTDRMRAWEDIVKHERLRSDLLSDLYDIQKSIISLLIVGSNPGGEAVQTLAANAQDISELLSFYDRTIDTARELVKP